MRARTYECTSSEQSAKYGSKVCAKAPLAWRGAKILLYFSADQNRADLVQSSSSASADVRAYVKRAVGEIWAKGVRFVLLAYETGALYTLNKVLLTEQIENNDWDNGKPRKRSVWI